MSELNREALKAAFEARARTDSLADAILAYLAALPKQEPSGEDYARLAKRTNQLEHLVGQIAMLLRKDMMEEPDPPKGAEG